MTNNQECFPLSNSIVVAGLLLLAAACGGSGGAGGGGPDYSAAFVGEWNGTLVATNASGQTNSTSGVVTRISATGVNALVIGAVCADESGPPATVTSPTSLTIGARACPAAPVTGCSSVVLAISKGTGILVSGTLSLAMDATLTGCSQTIPFSFAFTGTRPSTPSGSNPPPSSAPVASLRQTQYATTGTTATLDASASTGSSSAVLSFAWTLQSAPAGSQATLTDNAAPLAHITPDLAGDYVIRVVVTQGSLSSSASVTLSAFAPVTPIDFRPLDAEYSRALERLVAVSATPDRLHIFDPVSQLDTSVALPLTARCLNVSPDGLYAAVGHDAWVSYVDLRAAKVLATWPVSADAGDIVISDEIVVGSGTTRFAYVFPSRDQWVAVHDIDLGTGAETTSGGFVYAGMRAKLQPASNHIFGITTALSPQQLYRFDIGAAGITGGSVGSPYWGDYPMGLDIWLSRDGAQILSAAGTRFRTSDMTYAGKLSVASPISSADWSGEAARWIVQPWLGYYPSDPAADTSFWTVNSEYLADAVQTRYPRYVRAPEGYLLHGRYVFFDSTGRRRIAVVEIDSAASLLNDFAVLVFDQ